jgi:hypothetical protein
LLLLTRVIILAHWYISSLKGGIKFWSEPVWKEELCGSSSGQEDSKKPKKINNFGDWILANL